MTVRQPTKRRCSCVLALNTPLYVYIVYVGGKTIRNSAELRLESFIPHSSQVSIYHINVYWTLMIPKSSYHHCVIWYRIVIPPIYVNSMKLSSEDILYNEMSLYAINSILAVFITQSKLLFNVIIICHWCWVVDIRDHQTSCILGF